MCDLTDMRFGRLVVIEDFGKRDCHGEIVWLCKCDCGYDVLVRSKQLLDGVTTHCGCLKPLPIGNLPGGLQLQKRFHDMQRRCYNPKRPAYKLYGARGIKVCDEWLKDSNEFYKWALANGYKAELSIDRIDNNGDYSPENCRWVDMKTQTNNRRNTVKVLVEDKEIPITEYQELTGITSRNEINNMSQYEVNKHFISATQKINLVGDEIGDIAGELDSLMKLKLKNKRK